eukprot:Rmarinus@m.23445
MVPVDDGTEKMPDIVDDKEEVSSDSEPAEVLKKKKKKRKKKTGQLSVCVVNCRYEVVHNLTIGAGWKEIPDEEGDWNLYWTDTSVACERVMKMKQYQKINHFPGMSEISRKHSLARNLGRMRKMFHDEYNFFPQTWILPQDLNDFKLQFKKKKPTTFIVKPDRGCQGKGIYLTRSLDDIDPKEPLVAQKYVNKPFLIEGIKFDLRVYVLVLSCDPLHILLYNDGLARFATEPYTSPNSKNLDEQFMHLTNYSINKNNENFQYNENAEKCDEGSKRSIKSVVDWLSEHGYDAQGAWDSIADVIVKTLISIQPGLAHTYHTCLPDDSDGTQCFEILGFDVLLDRKLKPWLLEVNHSPSFHCDTPLDGKIKGEMIQECLQLVNIRALDRKKYQKQLRLEFEQRLRSGGKASSVKPKKTVEQIQKSRNRCNEKYSKNFVRIFPVETDHAKFDEYEMLLDGAEKIYRDALATYGRNTFAKPQSFNRPKDPYRMTQQQQQQQQQSTAHGKECGKESTRCSSTDRLSTRKSVSSDSPPVSGSYESSGSGSTGGKGPKDGRRVPRPPAKRSASNPGPMKNGGLDCDPLADHPSAHSAFSCANSHNSFNSSGRSGSALSASESAPEKDGATQGRPGHIPLPDTHQSSSHHWSHSQTIDMVPPSSAAWHVGASTTTAGAGHAHGGGGGSPKGGPAAQSQASMPTAAAASLVYGASVAQLAADTPQAAYAHAGGFAPGDRVVASANGIPNHQRRSRSRGSLGRLSEPPLPAYPYSSYQSSTAPVTTTTTIATSAASAPTAANNGGPFGRGKLPPAAGAGSNAVKAIHNSSTTTMPKNMDGGGARGSGKAGNTRTTSGRSGGDVVTTAANSRSAGGGGTAPLSTGGMSVGPLYTLMPGPGGAFVARSARVSSTGVMGLMGLEGDSYDPRSGVPMLCITSQKALSVKMSQTRGRPT